MYKLTLKVNNKEVKAKHENLEDALLMLKQESYKTKGVLLIEHEGKKLEKTMNFVHMRRAFNPKLIFRIVAAKRFKSFLK